MWIGDDDVVDVPSAGLLSDGYLADRSSLIRLDGRIANADLAAGNPWPYTLAPAAAQTEQEEQPIGHTTHFSIIDRWGNAVAMTTTMADTFGSGIMVPGYGFVLNDSLSLFNLTPKRRPGYGQPRRERSGTGQAAHGQHDADNRC